MTSCENVQHLQSFLSGTLSDADVSVVEVHLETCAECQAAMETICSTNENVAHQVSATPNAGGSEWSDDVARRLLEGVQNASVGASVDRDGAGPKNMTEGNFDETLPPKQTSETPPVSLAETAAPADTQPRAPSSTSGEMPEQFGRYRIVKTLGKGGMGAVYLAEDADLDRQVAIKVPFINDDDQDALDRFRREARSVAQIQHANICPVYDVSQFEGTHYMTMAFVEGKPLSDYVRPGKPLKIKQVVKLVQILAKALAFAHEAGIIHRDLKPANIMMSKRGQPIIMDFGLARREGKDDTQLTKSGQIMGTPSYMPPEQVAGRLEIMGPGCDIYSLGVIMFQLLTGEVPFQGDLLAVLSQIAMQKPTPPSEKRPGIDSELDAICLKALEKQPEDRFQSMNEFAGTLTDYAKGQSQTDLGETTPSVSGEHLPTVSSVAPVPSEDPKVTVTEPMPVVQPKTMSRVAAKTSSGKSFVGRNLKTLALAGGGAFVLLLSVVLYFQFGRKTLKVVVHDPSLKVVLENHALTISGKEQETITLKPGPETITVKRGDFKFATTNLTLKDGERVTIEIGYVDGLPTITKNGEPLAMAAVNVDEESTPLAQSRTSKRFALITLSDPPKDLPAVIVSSLSLPKSGPLTIEAYITLRSPPMYSEIDLVGQHGLGFLGLWEGRLGGYVFHHRLESMETTVVGRPIHAAVVRTDKSPTRLFLDGKLVKSVDMGGNHVEEENTNTFNIGNGLFDGLVDEVRVSTVARYTREFTPKNQFETDEHTLALYHCDGGQGDVLRDSSGNNHHGKIVGAKWVRNGGLSHLATAITPQDGWVDLLPLVDVEQDAVNGKFRIADGRLQPVPGSKSGNYPRIRLPVFLSGSTDLTDCKYELLVEGVHGKSGMSVVALTKGAGFNVTMEDDKVWAESGDGKEKRIRLPQKNGDRFRIKITSEVQGQNLAMQTVIDGVKVADWSEKRRFPGNASPQMRVQPHGTPALVFHETDGTGYFDVCRVRLISGEAKLLRPAAVTPNLDLSRGLVGHWNFEEGSGTRAADSSGNGNHGTLTDMDKSPWSNDVPSSRLAGKSSLKFSTEQGRVVVSPSDSLKFNDAVTVAFWGSFQENGLAVGRDKEFAINAGLGTFRLILAKEKALTLYGVKIEPNTWNHYVARYDGRQVTIFVDGVEQKRDAFDRPIPSGGQPIGLGGLAVGGQGMKGNLDDVRIYNRALSEAEISELAGVTHLSDSQALPPPSAASPPSGVDLTQGLVGHWNFEEGSGTRAADSSGNGNHGTLADMDKSPWSNDVPACRLAGKSSLKFSTEKGRVFVSPSDSLKLNDAATFAFWGSFQEGGVIVTRGYREEFAVNAGLGTLRLQLANKENPYGTTPFTVQNVEKEPNTWNHYVARYDGRHVTLFVNGVERKRDAFDRPILSGGRPMGLGGLADGGQGMKGNLDDIRIYNRALSDVEIAKLAEKVDEH